MKIPLMDLKAGFADYTDEIIEKVTQMIDKTNFIGGDEVHYFEKEFADFCNVKYAVGCANGTEAIEIALRALQIGSGQKVLVPANSFIATSEAVTLAGAEVDFVDVIESKWTIDPDKVLEYLKSPKGSNVKAIIAVHLYGRMADMDKLRTICDNFSLYLIEDSAQAHGAAFKGRGPGGWGDIATFSFYPGKNLGAFGDAGAIVTNNEELADFSKMFVNHGRIVGQKYEHAIEGANKRIDSIQAAILRIKLKHLEASTKKRIELAQEYIDALSDISEIDLPILDGSRSVFHLFVLHCKKRDGLIEYLSRQGISTGVHYPVCLPLQPAYRYLNKNIGDYPVAEKNASSCLSLPLWPEMTKDQQSEVIEAVKNYFRN